MDPDQTKRKPGRPKAIPEGMIPVVLSLRRQGLGYRSIARELREKGVSVDWSSVRRVLKAYSRLDGRQDG